MDCCTNKDRDVVKRWRLATARGEAWSILDDKITASDCQHLPSLSNDRDNDGIATRRLA